MGLLDHDIWESLRPSVRIETYDRDGGHRHPRHRIEVDTPADGILVRKFLAATIPCVVCGQRIHPVRQRQSKAVHLYIAVTCPLDVSYACARSAKAAEEYRRIVAAVRERHPSQQPEPGLF